MDKTYTIIPDFMLDYDLSITETVALAVVYGFCQDGESDFHGSYNYIARKCKVTRSWAVKIMNGLIAKGLVSKVVTEKNGVKYCSFRIVKGSVETTPPVQKLHQGGVETTPGGSVETTPNNIDNKIYRNKRESVFTPPTLDEVRAFWRERPSMIAEAKVVSDAIADPSSIIDTVKVVRPYMFRYPYFNELWEQILKAWREHTPIDETMVLRIKDKDAKWLIASYLGKSGVLETVNNAYALRDSYIGELALKQSLDLRKLSVDGITDSQKIMQSARTFVERLEGCYAENNSRNIDEAIEDLGEVLTQIREKRIEGKRPYIPTGFLFLDNYFKGGMHSGNVMVLAGRPGVGKTSVLLYMMQHMAAEGVAVKFYSCEMTIPELTEKVMYNLGGLRPYMMSSGEPDEHKWREAKAICKGWKFSIVNGMNNIHDIIADATILNQQGKCDIIFIDHLRLLQTGDSRLDANAYARTCEITRTIKRFSMLTGIPVVYVCQLNRESLKEDRDPGLQDLRDSGSIEEDADKVVFLKRKKIAEGDFQIKLIIGKHRQGAGTDEHIFLNPNDSYSGFTESEVDRSRDIDLTAEVIRR